MSFELGDVDFSEDDSSSQKSTAQSDHAAAAERTSDFCWHPPISMDCLPEESREDAESLFSQVMKKPVGFVSKRVVRFE